MYSPASGLDDIFASQWESTSTQRVKKIIETKKKGSKVGKKGYHGMTVINTRDKLLKEEPSLLLNI